MLERLLLAVTFLCCAGAAGPAAAAERHVVVVSIDGLAAFLLDDPKAPLPTVRRLAATGCVAVGGMTVSNPSVTWPNHTTLITGVHPERHGVLANGVLVRGGPGVPIVVDPRRDQRDLVRAATIVDAAHAAGLRTAEINWPCLRNAPGIDVGFPDVPDQVVHMSPPLRTELVAAGILADDTQASFMAGSAAARDLVWTEAARHVIRTRRPHLLLVHLLNVDATHHAAGAQSAAGYTANGYADMCLDRILAALDEAGIRERTTVFVVSDHGFVTTPKALRPNVLLRQKGLLTTEGNRITGARVHVYPEGGIGLVYVTNPGEAPDLQGTIRELFVGQEGVADVLLPEQFAAHGLPHPRRYDQAPDAILVAREGYAVSGSATGDSFVASHTEAGASLGSHGFLATLGTMNATCVVSGRGIRAGGRLEGVGNVDVAPTVAALLGIDGFAADGRVLREALLD